MQAPRPSAGGCAYAAVKHQRAPYPPAGPQRSVFGGSGAFLPVTISAGHGGGQAKSLSQGSPRRESGNVCWAVLAVSLVVSPDFILPISLT